MSDPQDITAEQVVNYLRNEPDFFEQHAALLELIRLPDPRGEAVSLLERQAQVLRERNHELRDRLNGLLDVARENDQLFEKTRKLSLSLIEARNSNQLFSNLIKSLKEDFRSDEVALLIYDREPDLEAKLHQHVQSFNSQALPEALQTLLRSGKAVCGTLRENELEPLFGERTAKIASSAMVPLEWQGRQGLLAIGSYDPQHFRSSLGTLFITHIGDVLSRRMADLMRAVPQKQSRQA